MAEANLRYRYFVSFNATYPQGGFSFNNGEVLLASPIRNIDDVNNVQGILEKKMKSSDGARVIVLSYVLFEQEE